MKILMISMFSPHFFNWAEQLKDSGHEIYWLDINDSNTIVKKINFAHHITGWRYKIDYPGRYLIKEKFPRLNSFINKFNERKLDLIFEKKLKEIKPDVIHSFVMYASCAPLLNIMNEHKYLPWIFSAWGNDLYFYRKYPLMLAEMKKSLQRIDYMFADCVRDYHIARDLGFKGIYLGTFPGRGGFELNKFNRYKRPHNTRNIILVKGYEHKFGRCNAVLKALSLIKADLMNYKVVVFGAQKEVLKYVQSKKFGGIANLEIHEKLPHSEVMKLMGQSLIFIGNSISDGTPNTLLEAIVMEAFPIQSNPGGATAEIIQDGRNGYLIEDPEDIVGIADVIKNTLINSNVIKKGVEFNNIHVKPIIERAHVKNMVISKYELVNDRLTS